MKTKIYLNGKVPLNTDLIDNRNIMFYCEFFVSNHMLFQIHMFHMGHDMIKGQTNLK